MVPRHHRVRGVRPASPSLHSSKRESAKNHSRVPSWYFWQAWLWLSDGFSEVSQSRTFRSGDSLVPVVVHVAKVDSRVVSNVLLAVEVASCVLLWSNISAFARTRRPGYRSQLNVIVVRGRCVLWEVPWICTHLLYKPGERLWVRLRTWRTSTLAPPIHMWIPASQFPSWSTHA